MTRYSHSRLSTYEKCPYQYKLKYIERPDVPLPPGTIEAFMGSMVHGALEKLYRDLGFQKRDGLDEIIGSFNASWAKSISDDVIVNNPEHTAENYRLTGEKCISDFYKRMHPFDQMTILGLETEDMMDLPNGHSYHVRIDKLGCRGKEYFVCDYKTDGRMKTQPEADADRQLAMYSKWVRDNHRDAEKTYLLWHMLRFDKDVVSERTDAQLDDLVSKTVALIDRIEGCDEWPTNRTYLCDYCVYKAVCPEFSHEAELKLLTPEQFAEDDGVRLVDEYMALNAQEKELKGSIEAVKSKVISFSEQKNVAVVYGTAHKLSVKSSDKVEYPKDMERIYDALKKNGTYDDYTETKFSKDLLSKDVLGGAVGKDVMREVSVGKGYRVTPSKRGREEEDG
ncbi:MAG: PD-(D/E)XK nuclease family protein [Candidatus Methanoplasma sp.]|jgi:putative RecB family exonuclease|nr:PD-(D/E)XK nuclease family protein [Candidatus Methanoplasma sp.]